MMAASVSRVIAQSHTLMLFTLNVTLQLSSKSSIVGLCI